MARRGWWGVAVVATIHFVAQTAAMVAAIGGGLARFDHGGEPGLAERFFDTATAVLQFPLVSLVRALPLRGTGHWSWLILLANSALWGIAIAAAWRRATRRRRPRTGRSADTPMAAS